MSADRRSQVQSTRSIVGAPESASSQPRGFTTSTMNPMMTVGQGSQLRPTSGKNRAPDSASSQLRGFTTSPPGEHLWQSSPSNRCPSPPSARTISLCSVSCPTPARAVDRLAKVSVPVCGVIDGDKRPGHSANEPTTSPAPAFSCGPTVTSSRRSIRTRRINGEPGGLRVQEAPGTSITLTMRVHDRGSKIDVQYYWTWRPRRWPTPWACPRDGLGFAALGDKA
jgi:hypothetical protein